MDRVIVKIREDELYTRLQDIGNELQYYVRDFRGRVVLCNCDDPCESNFFKYFIMNFNVFKLKKLITTSYFSSHVANTEFLSSDIAGEKIKENKKAYKTVIEKVETSEDYDFNLFGNANNRLSFLNGDGDFRSEECIELLKEADIVVTHPPYFLFKEYVKQLIEYNKKFIILGRRDALTYKEIFSLVKAGKMHLGYYAGDMTFDVGGSCGRDSWEWMDNICWYTNLDVDTNIRDIILGYREKNI